MTHWLRLNRRHRTDLDGETAPDRNVEYLFYQMLVGVWPVAPLQENDADAMVALMERVVEAMIKSVREGKEQSSWTWPNQRYEAALQRFVRGALDASRPNPFLVDFAEFVRGLERPAAIAGLSQLVLKLTVPGVADIYQGGELWDFSLVDPDNRRPVDWQQRQRLLDQIGNARPEELAEDWRDGREKLFATARLLGLRREQPDLFAGGDYEPLDISAGLNADRLCAFARRLNGSTVAVVVPRLTYRLYRDGGPADFGETEIALPTAKGWVNVFTREQIAAHAALSATELLCQFPVAVLRAQ